MATDETETGRPGLIELWPRVSHDLRQPIQALMLLTQVMSSTEDAATRQRTAAMMEDMLADLQGMLDDMAVLARWQAGGTPKIGLPRLLYPIAVAAAGRRAPMAAERGAEVVVIGRRTVAACCDEQLATELASDLIANALRLTAGSRVIVAVRQRQGCPGLECYFRGQPLGLNSSGAAFVEAFASDAHNRAERGLARGLGLIRALAPTIGAELECAKISENIQRITLLLPAHGQR